MFLSDSIVYVYRSIKNFWKGAGGIGGKPLAGLLCDQKKRKEQKGSGQFSCELFRLATYFIVENKLLQYFSMKMLKPQNKFFVFPTHSHHITGQPFRMWATRCISSVAAKLSSFFSFTSVQCGGVLLDFDWLAEIMTDMEIKLHSRSEYQKNIQ